MNTSKNKILQRVDELVIDFLEFNRQYDDDIKKGDIEKAILYGEITIEEILSRFEMVLKNSLKDYLEFNEYKDC
ncbi:MAG: hypothetical protein PHR06_12380 [Candidatus Cloacimonetes bacterium]|nr:hypothetical protein [Candidatus Cloacimonadota bacterium]